MIKLYTLIFIIITGTAHDLLIFDEFEYSFNLLDANDWDEHELSHDYSLNLNTNNDINPFQRRLITEYTFYSEENLVSLTNTDHASKCTDVIPIVFKQLCVHWNAQTGFKYNYKAPYPVKDRLDDTNWYYNTLKDKISDARLANQYYGDLLNADDVYIGDDAAWNEINYANKMSSFSLSNQETHNHYLRNFAKGSFKQCRHSPRMQECTEFHLPSKTLTVKIKTGRARREPNEEDIEEMNDEKAAREIPANLFDDDVISNANVMDDDYMDDDYMDDDDDYMDDDMDDDYMDDDYMDDDDDLDDYEGYYDNYYEDEMEQLMQDVIAYDFDHEFEYGDARGYHNWAADMMGWDRFKCANCMDTEEENEEEQQQRRLFEMQSIYDKYGDYTYLFHDHSLDFANDDDWNEISKEGGMKCSIAIPGFEHKLCVDLTTSNDDAKISFAAAADDDIDYGYYDMYGYDMYYYNIDHLYDHGAHPQHDKAADAEEDINDYLYGEDEEYDMDLNDDDDDDDDLYYDIDTDTDTDTDAANNKDTDDDYGYNFDYYHTRSDEKDARNDGEDNNDDDNGDNEDDEAAENKGSMTIDDEERGQKYDQYGDENDQRDEKFPDIYKQFQRAEDAEEQNELRGGNGMNGMGGMGGMGGSGMMNPMQQMMANMMYNYGGTGRRRRRMLSGMDRDYLMGIGLANTRSKLYSQYDDDMDSNDDADDDDDDYSYFDEDYYEDLIDDQMEQIDEFNQAFIDTLRSDLSDVALNFNNDDSWDDITNIHDANRQKWIRKCASFQTAQLCATTDPGHKNLKLNLKIGKHKFHRTYRPWEKQESDALEDITNIYSDNIQKKAMENMDAMDTTTSDDEQWGIDAGIIDVDDAEWNNDALWTSVAKIPAIKSKKLKKGIVRKCKGLSFCLCQYIDKKFDSGQKHKCISSKTHNKIQPHYKLLNVMDEFLAGPLGLAKHNKLPINIQFQYHPSIVHYHIMARYPFFNRRHHLHRYKVPWFKYKKYQHLRPNVRPKWLARWIWREVAGHLKRPKGFKQNKAERTKKKKGIKGKAAHFDEFDYYDYDGGMVDNMDDLDYDNDDFEDELPYIVPLIRASATLLTNPLSNARKILPKVLRKSVAKGGFIHNALKGRGGPAKYGTFGGFGGGEIRKTIEHKGPNKKIRRRMKGEYDDEMDDEEEGEYYDDMDDDDMDEVDDIDDIDDEEGYYDDLDEEEDDDYDVDVDEDDMDEIADDLDEEEDGDYYDDAVDDAMDDMDDIYDDEEEYYDDLDDDVDDNDIDDDEDDYYDDDDDEEEEDEYYDEMDDDDIAEIENYLNNDDEEEVNIIDDWFDEETGMNWIVTMDDLNDELQGIDSENMEWEEMKTIIGNKGNKIQRRCMNVFGRQLCICQFLQFIGARRVDHLCYPMKKKQVNRMRNKLQRLRRIKKKIMRKLRRKRRQKIKRRIKKKAGIKKMKKFKKKLKKKAAIKKKKGIKLKLKKKPSTKKKKKVIKKQIIKEMNKKAVHKKAAIKKVLNKKIKKLQKKNKKMKKKKVLKKKKKVKKLQKKHKKAKKKILKLNKSIKKHKKKIQKTVKKVEKLELINGKPLGPMTIKKIERANKENKERKKLIKKKLKAKKKAKKILKRAQKNILKEKAKEIRKSVKRQLPKQRPLWLPHYFWHWMHRAPHFHLLRHKYRNPWIPGRGQRRKGKAAYVEEEDVIEGFEDEIKGNEEMDDWYIMDDDDDMEDEEEDGYDELNENEEGEYDELGEEDEHEMDENEGWDDYEEEDGNNDDEEENEEEYDEEDEDGMDANEGWDGYEEEDGYDDDDDDEEEDVIQGFEDEIKTNAAMMRDMDDEYMMDEDDAFDADDEAYDGYDAFYDDDDDYEEDKEYEVDENAGWDDYEDEEELHGYDDDDYYEEEEDADDADGNYLENGNDFTAINGDSGEYSSGFMWVVGFVSFILFCIFAFFVSIGIRRRRRKLYPKLPDQQYLQQALEMTESESESGSDQQFIE